MMRMRDMASGDTHELPAATRVAHAGALDAETYSSTECEPMGTLADCSPGQRVLVESEDVEEEGGRDTNRRLWWLSEVCR
jgi:hypothetical protein